MGSPHQRGTKVHGCQVPTIGEDIINVPRRGEGPEDGHAWYLKPNFSLSPEVAWMKENLSTTVLVPLQLTLTTLRPRNSVNSEGRYVSLPHPDSTNNCLAQMFLESDLVWGSGWCLYQHDPQSENRLKVVSSRRRIPWSPGCLHYIVCSNFYYLIFLIFSTTVWFRSENLVSFIFIPSTRNSESLIKLSVDKGMKRQSRFLTMVTDQKWGWTRSRGRTWGETKYTCPKAAGSEGERIVLMGKTSRNIPADLGAWDCQRWAEEGVKRRNWNKKTKCPSVLIGSKFPNTWK